MRRALAVLASIGLGIGTIALTTPAYASTSVNETATCSTANSVNDFSEFPNGITLTISVPTACRVLNVDKTFVSSTNDVGFSLSGAVVALTATDRGNLWQFSWQANEIDEIVIQSVPVSAFEQSVKITSLAPATEFDSYGFGSLNPGPVPDSGSSGGVGSSPASEIQQFGLPASGNCEDGATAAMNWSGIGMDGWGISWAQWMNEGVGGAVCTRTVVYDTSSAKWVVN